MLLEEFVIREKMKVDQTVIEAGRYLERRGELFNITFHLSNAVDKASEMLCVFLDEDMDWIAFRKQLKAQGDWS
jgi:hypothetical protein